MRASEWEYSSTAVHQGNWVVKFNLTCLLLMYYVKIIDRIRLDDGSSSISSSQWVFHNTFLRMFHNKSLNKRGSGNARNLPNSNCHFTKCLGFDINISFLENTPNDWWFNGLFFLEASLPFRRKVKIKSHLSKEVHIWKGFKQFSKGKYIYIICAHSV